MPIKLKIRKGDRVMVRAGRDRGKVGEVLGVFPREMRALVRGVHMVKRHQRQSPTQEGGIVERESRIHISNLAIVDPSTGEATRVGFRVMDDGEKRRVAKKSGEVIDRG